MGSSLGKYGCKCKNKQSEDEFALIEYPDSKNVLSSSNGFKPENQFINKDNYLTNDNNKNNNQIDSNNQNNLPINNNPIYSFKKFDAIILTNDKNKDNLNENENENDLIFNQNSFFSQEKENSIPQSQNKENNNNTNNNVNNVNNDQVIDNNPWSEEEIEKDFSNFNLRKLRQNLLSENKENRNTKIANLNRNINNNSNTNQNYFTKNSLSPNKKKNNTYNTQGETPIANFLSFHKLSFKQPVIINNTQLIKEIPKITNGNILFNDIIFCTDLLKLNIVENTQITSKNQKYILKYCAMTSREFKYFQSKEKFIMLEHPIGVIQLANIKRVGMIKFDNEKLNKKKGKLIYNFIIWSEAPSNVFDIFASENEQVANIWVDIINYFSQSENDKL